MLYPECKAQETWEKDGVRFSIVRMENAWELKSGTGRGYHYCGDARFSTCPRVGGAEGYDGFFSYVPVHGGITYAEHDEDGWCYGFDCHHADDENNDNLINVEWLRAECERMAGGIVLAAQYEPKYLLESDSAKRADIIQEYHDDCLEKIHSKFVLADNFGASLNVLIGNL